jgi:hypothetical protein
MSAYPQPREIDVPEYSCTFCADPIKGEMFRGEFVSEGAREDGEGRLIHENCVIHEIASTLTPKQLFDMNRFVAAVRTIQDVPRETLALFDRHPLIDFGLRELKEAADGQMEHLDPDPSPFTEELILVRASDVVRCKAALAVEIGRVKGEIFTLSPAAPLALKVKTERLEFLKKAANGLTEASHAD